MNTRKRKGSNRKRALKRNSHMNRIGRYCYYCGIEMQAFNDNADNFFTLDHVIPKSHGGRGGDNIVPCCIKCNGEKASKNINIFKRDKNMNMNNFP